MRGLAADPARRARLSRDKVAANYLVFLVAEQRLPDSLEISGNSACWA